MEEIEKREAEKRAKAKARYHGRKITAAAGHGQLVAAMDPVPGQNPTDVPAGSGGPDEQDAPNSPFLPLVAAPLPGLQQASETETDDSW